MTQEDDDYERNQVWINHDPYLPLCGWGLGDEDYDPYAGLTEKEYCAMLEDDYDNDCITDVILL